MSTSLHGGRIQFNPDLYDNEEAFDTAFARVALNNALHLADEAAQVRVNFPPTASQGVTSKSSSTTADIYVAKFGPFPMHIASDRTPYKLRVRMHAKLGGAGTVTFKCVVHPSSMNAVDVTTSTNTVSAECSSTTAAWLTNTTDNLAVLNAVDVLAAFRRLDTIAAVGGDLASVHWPLFSATVLARSTSGTPTTTITGLQVIEYIGT